MFSSFISLLYTDHNKDAGYVMYIDIKTRRDEIYCPVTVLVYVFTRLDEAEAAMNIEYLISPSQAGIKTCKEFASVEH